MISVVIVVVGGCKMVKVWRGRLWGVAPSDHRGAYDELFSYYFIVGPVVVEGKVCGHKVLPPPVTVRLLNDFPSAFCLPMAVPLPCASHNESNHAGLC